MDSVSLVANGQAYEDALKKLADMPEVLVGIHFNIIEGCPVSPPDTVGSLLGQDGKFKNSYLALFAGFLCGKIKKEEVVTELSSQLNLIRSSGVNIDYFDSHRHIHLFPPISKLLSVHLRNEQIDKVRLIKPTWFDIRWSVSGLVGTVMFALSRRIYGWEKRRTDYFLGLGRSGNITREILCLWFEKIRKENTYEIACHLGDNDIELENFFQWRKIGYNASWEGELEALTSLEVKKLINSN